MTESFPPTDKPATDVPEVLDERTRLDLDIATLESKINAHRNRFKVRILVTTAMAIFMVIFAYVLFTASNSSLFREVSPGALISLVSAYAFFFVVFYSYMSQSRISSMQAEIDLLKARKRILYQLEPAVGKSGELPPVSYFDSLVRINVENLAEYYNLVKVHTDNSFRVSIVVSVVGFIFILVGLAVGFFNTSSTQTISYISTGAGIVIEFIAGVFFYLYNRTVIRLKDYHDSLLAVQNILLSFKIVGDTRDEKEKAKMVSQMIVFLIGKQSLPVSQTNAVSGEQVP